MFRLYRKYLKKYRKHIIFGQLSKLVEAVFELLVPLVIANIIDNGLNNSLLSSEDKISFILKQGWLLLIFAVVGLCSTLICQYLASKASQGVGTTLRDDLYRHINLLSYKELDELNAASLLTRMNTDINNVQVSVAMLIRLVIRAPFLVVGATFLSFMVSIKAGFIFLISGILLFAFIMLVMFYIVPKTKLASKHLDNVTRISKENIQGNRVVRAFSRQKEEFVRYVDANISLHKIQNFIGKMNALLNPMTFIITNIAIVIVLYLGSVEFTSSTLEQGDITSLYNYLLQIQLAITVVVSLVLIFTKAVTSSSRINEVFDKKSSLIEGCETSFLDEYTPFEFKNVTFKYNENGLPAIRNISFKVKSGMTVGVIGGTGSGKTTLVNLMNHFYDVNEGEILFYGRRISDYDQKIINDNIALVMQRVVLFSGTIKDNILWGNKEASEEEVIEALKISQSYEFVSKLENSFDTILYLGGKNLSGGQRQRLSIARAIIKPASILILDDASSALDFKTDLLLRQEISKLNKTTFIISQRASTIMHADLILVLEQGQLVGVGTHKELIKSCEIYQEICDSQDVSEVDYEK